MWPDGGVVVDKSTDAWMSRALELALLGLGRTETNPIVGAVIVRDGVLVGEGHHEFLGGPHAEIVALNQAGGAARGASIYVTLEPCAHQGRTGPCADALIAAGIKEVFIASRDLNPIAKGGIEKLEAAGIGVHLGLLRERAEWENRAWRHWVANLRPYVIWKVAASVDGRIAAPDGSSRWISSAESRADAHSLRGASQAIVTSTGTVLRDDAELSARDGSGRTPIRVVVGKRPISPGARIFSGDQETVIIKDHSPLGVVDELTSRGAVQAMLECGPQMAGDWFELGLIDELIVYLAPILIGGGPSLFSDLKVASISDKHELFLHDVQRFGPDLRTTYTTTGWE